MRMRSDLVPPGVYWAGLLLGGGPFAALSLYREWMRIRDDLPLGWLALAAGVAGAFVARWLYLLLYLRGARR